MTETKQLRKKTVQPGWLIFAGFLTLVGIAAWIVQLNQGIGATSLSNITPWGMYIAGFIFFMGLSAGSLVLASLPVLFKLPKFRPYSKLSAFLALISLIVGGLFICVDIGKPERLWRIVRYAELASPMLWDLILTVVYLIVSIVFLRRLMNVKDNSSDGLKGIALVALLAGLADGLTAFVFATQIGRDYWFSAVQPMAFFMAALASAGAVLIVLMLTLRKSGYVSLESFDLEPVALLTAGALGLDFLLTISEVSLLVFTRSETALEQIGVMFTSPFFWIEIAAGAAAILVLVLPETRVKSTGLAFGAGLGLLHLVVKRIFFVQMGFAIENINFAGISIAPPNTGLTLVEIGVVFGLIGLFTFLLSLGLQKLKLGTETTI